MGRWLTPDPAGLAAVDLTNPQSLNLGGPSGGLGDVPCYLTEGYYCGYGPPQQSEYPYGPPPGSSGGSGQGTAPGASQPSRRNGEEWGGMGDRRDVF